MHLQGLFVRLTIKLGGVAAFAHKELFKWACLRYLQLDVLHKPMLGPSDAVFKASAAVSVSAKSS